MKTKHRRHKKELKVEVYLDDADVMLLNESGIDSFRKHLVEKYALAFHKAGTTLTIDDLAFFLHTIPEQVLQDICEIEHQKKIILPVIGSGSWSDEKQKKRRKEDCAASSS